MGSGYSLTVEIGGFFRENPQSETKFIFKTAIWLASSDLGKCLKVSKGLHWLIENQTVITEEQKGPNYKCTSIKYGDVWNNASTSTCLNFTFWRLEINKNLWLADIKKWSPEKEKEQYRMKTP